MRENILTKSNHIPQHLTGVAKIILFIIIVILFTNRSHNTSALSYQSTTDLQFTFNPVVSINISGGDLSIANLTPGSYADSNIITITASSNNADGYTLYGTVGSSTNNSTELRKDGTDTTNKFSSITSNISTLSGFSDSSNTWGYSYSTDSGSTWVSGNQGSTSTGYNGLPLYNSTNAATGVILANTSTASESTIQFKIGARATNDQISGAYTNVVNFIGVPKVITRNYTIAYDANGGTGAPSSTSGTVTSTDPIVTLSTTAPTREGYIFKGWCNVSTSDDTCSGTTTQPGHIYAVNTTNTSAITVTMYAMWKPAKLYMWNATSADCGKTMWDNRDGTERSYTTATINGLCWMTTNLALGKDTTTILTNSNTNLNGSLTSYTLPASATSGFSSSSAENIYNSGSTTCSDTSACYGYYTYAAATAGTNPSSDAAASDICPKGWRLPTQAELSSLAGSYNTGAKLVASPFLGVYAGYYYNSQLYSGGSYGFYWSSTAYASSHAYGLAFYSSGADINHHYKYNGFSIRCIQKLTMQSATSSDLATLMPNVGDTTTLPDARDGAEYSITKLNDGNYWMTQNLRFTGTSLKTTDSNVNSDKTMTWYDLASDSNCTSTSTSGNGMTYTCIKYNNDTSYGAYYNYAAATAGTITGDNNSAEAQESVCPAGWRLPTYSEFYNITSYTTAFSPVYSGYYGGGSLHETGSSGRSYWWSSTANGGTGRYILRYNSGSLSTYVLNRYYGFAVRCIKN